MQAGAQTPRCLFWKLGIWEWGFEKKDAAVAAELETPFLLAVHLVEDEW